MSTRQMELIQAIETFTSLRKFPPTVRELCVMMGVSSTMTVHDMLKNLRNQGKVEWQPNKRRTLKVVK